MPSRTLSGSGMNPWLEFEERSISLSPWNTLIIPQGGGLVKRFLKLFFVKFLRSVGMISASDAVGFVLSTPLNVDNYSTFGLICQLQDHEQFVTKLWRAGSGRKNRAPRPWARGREKPLHFYAGACIFICSTALGAFSCAGGCSRRKSALQFQCPRVPCALLQNRDR